MTDPQTNTSSVIELANYLFPYEYKHDQKAKLEELTASSYSLFSAPTGYGKSVVALVSSLAHLLQPESDIKTILVLVKTKTQIFRIMDECKTIFITARKRGFFKPLYTVPLLAKEELCVHETQPKGYIHCEHLRCRYYPKQKPLPTGSRLQQIVTTYSTQEMSSSTDLKTFLTTISKGCCPYYLLRKILTHAQIIVTTHAWLLNFSLREVLFTQLPLNPANTALIIDEVHNFTTPYKTEITFTDIFAALKVAQKYQFACQTFLEKFFEHFRIAYLDIFSQFLDSEPEPWLINQLTTAILHLQTMSTLTADDREGLAGLQALVALFRSEGNYWYYDARITKKGEKTKVLGHIQVYAPMYFQMITSFKRILLMSATLYSLSLYKVVFGLTGITFITAHLQPKTSFLAIYMNARISSRLRTRSIYLYMWQVLVTRDLHTRNPGHTIVFSPSHRYTQFLASVHTRYCPDEHIYVENTSDNNQSILTQLRAKDHELVYATFGGSFSEGVEVVDPKTKHSKITLIIFTGIPIPPPTIAQYILKYAYTVRFTAIVAKFLVDILPVYHMLLQAAGRGIRRPTDRCALVCLDYRLALIDIFPHKTIIKTNRLKYLSTQLEKFYTYQL